jgi:hypothetical protein
MKKWENSEWFEQWLALARNTTEEARPTREQSISFSSGHRQITQTTDAGEPAVSSQWEITE